MDLHLELSPTAPLRSQLEHALRDSIRSGRLVDGAKLPPSRTLASDLGISRGVVVDAYEQLVAEGYLVARPGDGTRVASTAVLPAARIRPAPAATVRPQYNLQSGTPDLAAFPRNEWAAALTQALHGLRDSQLGYVWTPGIHVLREQLAAYLGRVRAVATDPDHIAVTCGCTHGMTLIWSALRARGARRVAIEDPCWAHVRRTVIAAGLEPVPIPVDAQGLQVELLEQADVSAVAISPAHQYPVGSVLSPERRQRLIAWAQARGAVIVEDDYDAEFRYDREPIGSLQGLAPAHVAYLGSASKTIAPGLSLGWIALPGGLAAEVAAIAELPRAVPAAFVQAAYASLLERGRIDRHLRRMRRSYQGRRDRLIEALAGVLPGCRIDGAQAGLHLLLWLPDGLEEQAVAAACSEHGVAVDTLRGRCDTARPLGPALILGYGQIEEAAIPAAARAMRAACAPGAGGGY